MAYPSEQPAQPLDGAAHEGAAFERPAFDGPPRADWRQWFQLPGRPRRRDRSLAVGFGVAAAVAALGALLGLLWGKLAPAVPVIKLGDGSIVVTDPSPEQYIAADGWFTLLGLGFGLIVTVVAWLALRRDRGPFLLLGVVGGAFAAGRWVAPAVGEMLGRDAYDQWRTAAAQGATYLAPPEVQSLGPKLVPAFIAAIVLTLLAGWSNDPDLDHPGAQPGYGPNHGYPPYPGDQPPYGAPGTGPSGGESYGAPGAFGPGGETYRASGGEPSSNGAPGGPATPSADALSPYAPPSAPTSEAVAPERSEEKSVGGPPTGSGQPHEGPRHHA
ncbi:hypothetical protein Aph02nite_19100 [Actinoplanes philippinensis]|uniref:DUF2567 domain-containing protein n=1 Tax=Actinoplanes philippinensis TaxID=35752 RepID=A0A1I2BKY5_9ACTN|nr:DUF2567 domain-containing protein [Actinoplanes philippinensis]GIE75960.1 hypothetical protein Aph02nite_19100 [Actinoplanes philippinensis]SFE56659.1 hypothetical protein SAMN05421541_102377 [Actinoplanes philippinensis]